MGENPAHPFPTAALPPGPVDAVSDAIQYRLTPGDVLYIPRGHAHEATTTARSSLHLTVGIHAFTWADLLGEVLRLAAMENSELRRALPIGHLAEPLGEADQARIADRAAAMATSSIIEAARLSLGSRLLRQNVAVAVHFPSLDAVPDLSTDSIVQRGFEGPSRIRNSGERVVVEYPGNFISVPRSLAPAMTYALATPSFKIGSLPGELTGADQIELAARLVREGFLKVADNGKDVRQ